MIPIISDATDIPVGVLRGISRNLRAAKKITKRGRGGIPQHIDDIAQLLLTGCAIQADPRRFSGNDAIPAYDHLKTLGNAAAKDFADLFDYSRFVLDEIQTDLILGQSKIFAIEIYASRGALVVQFRRGDGYTYFDLRDTEGADFERIISGPFSSFCLGPPVLRMLVADLMLAGMEMREDSLTSEPVDLSKLRQWRDGALKDTKTT